MVSTYTPNTFDLPLSEEARTAFRDLKSVGYDIDALTRMNLNDERIIEIRDKEYQYRGIEPLEDAPRKNADEFATFFGLGIDLSLKISPNQARFMVKHLFYLAERELSQS